MPDAAAPSAGPRVTLRTVAREWARLGCVGFGGPPTHIALLRQLCVADRGWIDGVEFEDAIAAANLLPGPASTQLAIYCARRVGGFWGGVVGGACFIAPGLVVILALSAAFLARHPAAWVVGAAAGAGAAVPAVALAAAWALTPTSWRRLAESRASRSRWAAYALAGALSPSLVGPYLVLVLLACGAVEIAVRSRGATGPPGLLALAGHAAASGGLLALAGVALTVGALSYGGGFVIVPLMQHSVVTTYHWLSAEQFVGAVALGQVTPGPVVLTVAVVGYAVGGVGGGLLAAGLAFAPSFLFVLGGGRHFARVRTSERLQWFLSGAGAAAIGAIAGSAVPLGRALDSWWQVAVLAGALAWLFGLRRGVVGVLVLGGVLGALLALAGVSV